MSKVRKIAFEEHYTAVGFKDYSKSFAQHIDPTVLADLARGWWTSTKSGWARWTGAASTTSSCRRPGRAQAEPDAAVALRRARENNDFLVQQVARHPTRYGAFATIPMHDPRVAAAELERCVRQLGFKAR